jgi:hypothetical protein
MCLCTRKFGPRLFHLSGFRREDEERWNQPPRTPAQCQEIIERFLNGTTGMGLIDALQREICPQATHLIALIKMWQVFLLSISILAGVSVPNSMNPFSSTTTFHPTGATGNT